MSRNPSYDAVVVGGGPNGLGAALRLSLEGLSVLLIEGNGQIGGGCRTEELMEPGVHHDICSAIHPMAAVSPFLSRLPLGDHGLDWIEPPAAVAHPLDSEPAALLYRDIDRTADGLSGDADAYRRLMHPLHRHWESMIPDLLAPLRMPDRPVKLARFGLHAIQSARGFSRRHFRTRRARALFAGIAAHSVLPLEKLMSAAVGLVLSATGHSTGWPLPRGGASAITDAMASLFRSLGGEIRTGHPVTDLGSLPPSRATLLSVTPQQLIEIAGDSLPSRYKRSLRRYRYGAGVYKADYILSEPVPWKDSTCRLAGTVHLGGSLEEIALSERQMSRGEHSESPYVLVAQQSLFDPSRTPDNRHTLWAYCHVPSGSEEDMSGRIEAQIERFAPGFQDVILSRRTLHTSALEAYNPNYVGGDINGGVQDLRQHFSRPVSPFRPYATPLKGVYLCSSSTPPGGGVHGMCGAHAAELVLQREFGLNTTEWQFRL